VDVDKLDEVDNVLVVDEERSLETVLVLVVVNVEGVILEVVVLLSVEMVETELLELSDDVGGGVVEDGVVDELVVAATEQRIISSK
jgi:hypothetical protein